MKRVKGLARVLIPAVAIGSAASAGGVEPTATRVFWGDTHVHTALSGDAFALGTRLTPDDAYRFAKGEAVVATGGTRSS